MESNLQLQQLPVPVVAIELELFSLVNVFEGFQLLESLSLPILVVAIVQQVWDLNRYELRSGFMDLPPNSIDCFSKVFSGGGQTRFRKFPDLSSRFHTAVFADGNG